MKVFLLTIWLVISPYNIQAKQCPLKIDKWYRIENDWFFKCPDKFQHSFFSYVGQILGQRIVDEKIVFILINSGGAFKEFYVDDEGYSFRDMVCNFIGSCSGILIHKTNRFAFVPAWGKNEILLKGIWSF